MQREEDCPPCQGLGGPGEGIMLVRHFWHLEQKLRKEKNIRGVFFYWPRPKSSKYGTGPYLVELLGRDQ